MILREYLKAALKGNEGFLLIGYCEYIYVFGFINIFFKKN